MDRSSKTRKLVIRAALAVTLASTAAACTDSHQNESNGICEDAGTPGDDKDCCEASGGFWTEGLEGGGCAVPGPFVPPSSPV